MDWVNCQRDLSVDICCNDVWTVVSGTIEMNLYAAGEERENI